MRGGSCVCVCVSKSVRLQYVCAALKVGRRPEATVSCFCSQLCEGRMWCETTGRCSCTAPQLETRERECVMAEFLDMDVCVCAVCWALADSYESITLICQLPPLIQLISVMRTDVCTCCHGHFASETELHWQDSAALSGHCCSQTLISSHQISSISGTSYVFVLSFYPDDFGWNAETFQTIKLSVGSKPSHISLSHGPFSPRLVSYTSPAENKKKLM